MSTWAFSVLPCARITSIRFKGTVSVDGRPAINTPSEDASLWVTRWDQFYALS
jgi:hypothetical protein